MITTSPSHEVLKRREETLCKFIREYIYKVSQVVVAARRASNIHHNGSLSESWNDLHSPFSQWFRIEMNDSQRLHKYIEEECIGTWDPRHSNFELTIDISLSAEPLSEHVLLERWKIKHFVDSKHFNNESTPSLIYKRMCVQIRSILSYLRLLPSHCIVQSWEQSMTEQSQLIKDNKSCTHNMIPFALYHLIYSYHNKQNDNISNFAGNSKSFSFEPLITRFGKIITTVFYGANITKDFRWLIAVPGKNPPLLDDNLSQHIDGRSRYWDKKDNLNKIKTPSRINTSPSNFEIINVLNRTPPPIVLNRTPPPIKSLNNIPAFHESPVLDPSTPKLDPIKEMEKIRLSTIFGSAPPVISLADVSTINNNNNGFLSGSQLMKSIVNEKEKQIMKTRKQGKQLTIMKTLSDIEIDNELSDDVSSDVDMKCDESDHDDIQDEIFEGYNDNMNQKNIAIISEFINMCCNVDKLKLESFKTVDPLLEEKLLNDNDNDNQDDSKKYFNLISKHFQIRQQRLIQMKRTSTNILSNSIMMKQ